MMRSARRKSIAFFIVLGSCIVGLTIALNVSWIVLNIREVALMVLGIVFFGAIIGGVVLNTIFLVREIRRNEQHDAFINSVTHELKTPVASIKLYLETLKSREVQEAKRSEFYDFMLADSDRLLHTIEQVLRAGQQGARHRRHSRTRIDLLQLVTECVDLSHARYNLSSEQLKFTERTPENGPAVVLGDGDELRAAVLNLIDNAVKYSRPNEIRIRAELDNHRPNTAVISILDNGIGFSKDQSKRIFKRFYRAPGKLAGRVKGTGLGLFIVKSIVSRHGGRVSAESEGEGKGSRFVITLPKVNEI